MKKCITISGGFDSACLPFLVDNLNEWDLVFFDYNQIYKQSELQKAQKYAEKLNKKLNIIRIEDMHHDQERRNFLFLFKLKTIGYDIVMMGCRNILPTFDRYKDSNLINLKFMAYLLHIQIKLPIVGWRKGRVIRFLRKRTDLDFYNCYKNNQDTSNCDCVNCIELKKLK